MVVKYGGGGIPPTRRLIFGAPEPTIAHCENAPTRRPSLIPGERDSARTEWTKQVFVSSPVRVQHRSGEEKHDPMERSSRHCYRRRVRDRPGTRPRNRRARCGRRRLRHQRPAHRTDPTRSRVGRRNDRRHPARCNGCRGGRGSRARHSAATPSFICATAPTSSTWGSQ